ncbi:hypothetical protein T6A38_31955, partial [Pseudomonas aeruginosa]|nr:hypothetical protein [Pseudomonas aeruginosa]
RGSTVPERSGVALSFCRRRVIDPLLYVRDRLGHSSVATTQRYLHLISMIEDDVMGEYQEFIDSVCVGRI